MFFGLIHTALLGSSKCPEDTEVKSVTFPSCFTQTVHRIHPFYIHVLVLVSLASSRGI